MHKCQCCGYMFEDNNMQRISLNMVGKPYNICKSCADKYKKKACGMMLKMTSIGN